MSEPKPTRLPGFSKSNRTKQTEVGAIPEDWELVRLGEISEIGAGGTPHRENAKYWKGDIPWITTSQIDFNEIVSAEQFITEEGLRSSAAKLLPAGTLLLALYGQGKTRGKVAVLGIAATTNQACASILLRSGTSTDFVRHFLSSRYESIRNASNGGSQDNLNGQIVRQFPVCLPPLAEQRAIAEALSDVDELITSLDRLIAKKRDVKQGAMQQLLTGKTRLPGFTGSDVLKPTQVGMLPDSWTVARLGSCLQSHPSYGINAPAVPFSDKLPRYIRITDISEDGRFAPSAPVCVDSPNSKDYLLQDDDIVVARTGASVGKSYLFRGEDGPLVFAGFLIRFRADTQRVLPAFLASWLMTGFYWRWVMLMSMRSGQPGINGNEYALLPVPIPPLPEQRAIADVLSDMDGEITALEARRDKSKLLKQGMMQELLTGKTRLV